MHKFKTKLNEIMKICKKVLSTDLDKRGNIFRSRGPKPCWSDCFIIAVSIFAEFEGIDSESRLIAMLKKHKRYFPHLISRRQYNDRRRALLPYCTKLQQYLANQIDEGEDYFCIDSKPISVCRLSRSHRCHFGKAEGYRSPDWGYCASQQMHYFGYKLHAVCGLRGVIHSYDISKASVHDIHYLKDIKDRFFDCTIIGDKGYINADIRTSLFETQHIRLEYPYRVNQKGAKPFNRLFSKSRRRIETVFSQLTDQFMIMRNYAKSVNGLFARLGYKLCSYTFAQYINWMNNKPIGKIKYALN